MEKCPVCKNYKHLLDKLLVNKPKKACDDCVKILYNDLSSDLQEIKEEKKLSDIFK